MGRLHGRTTARTQEVERLRRQSRGGRVMQDVHMEVNGRVVSGTKTEQLPRT